MCLKKEKIEIGGYEVAATGVTTLVQKLLSLLRVSPSPISVFCLNHYAMTIGGTEPEFGASLRQAGVLIPDGIFVQLSAFLRGKRINRITGYDLFWHLNKFLNRAGGYSCFFLGSTEDVVTRLIKRFRLVFPAVKVAGYYCPPFMDDFVGSVSEKMVALVNASGADILWVGIAQPKQEKWIHRNKNRLKPKLLCAIGAVFEFFALKERRAPSVFRDLGLEWLWRCFTKPRRTVLRLAKPLIYNLYHRSKPQKSLKSQPPTNRNLCK